MINIWRNIDDNKSIFEKIYENLKQKKSPVLQIYNIEEEKKKNEYQNIINEVNPITHIKRKKGRKLKEEVIEIKPHERIHSRLNSDNIKRKIKTHFHSFIVSYLNFVIKKEFDGIQKYKFKKMDSEITQNITISYNRTLLDTPLRIILKKVSNKFNDHLSNERILSKIPISKTEINNLLNCTYREMYERYYLTSRNELFNYEKDNNSFENHLLKIKNNFGVGYMEKYKSNALKFIEFFLNCKERKKKLFDNSFNEDNNSELNVKNNESTLSTKSNSESINHVLFVTKYDN
jgi:hemoglobin-like flavoprotein